MIYSSVFRYIGECTHGVMFYIKNTSSIIVHSDTNQWFFNPVDDKRQVTRVLLILALVVSRTVNLEGTGCVLDGWTRWLLSVLRVAQTSK